MGRPLACSMIVAAAIFAVGCSEKSEAPPTGPELHTISGTSSGCDFQHLGQLANTYFSPAAGQNAVKTLVDQMTTAGAYTLDAKNRGFDIMVYIENAVNNGNAGVPSVGSDLMNHLLLCMYNPAVPAEAASYPASFPDTFNVALTASASGAFGHRITGTDPVYARPIKGFSGIAPSTTWQDVLDPNNSPARVVFYGRPATTASGAVIPQTYDWRTIPRNAAFDPSIIIGLCIDADVQTTAMVNEVGVAVLSFTAAGFLGDPSLPPSPDPSLGGCSTSLTLSALLHNPFLLAGRLVRFGTDLLAPAQLRAATLSPGTSIGGSGSRCCSQVGPKNVPSVTLTITDVTPSRIHVGQRFSLTATVKSGTDLVNGTRVSLSTIVNSGVTTIKQSASGSCSSGITPEGITGTGSNSAGTFLWDNNLCFTSTGNVYIVATADVVGRLDSPVTVRSNKINVIP